MQVIMFYCFGVTAVRYCMKAVGIPERAVVTYKMRAVCPEGMHFLPSQQGYMLCCILFANDLIYVGYRFHEFCRAWSRRLVFNMSVPPHFPKAFGMCSPV